MRQSGLIYFLLGVYSAMVSWFYYHSIFWLIINWIAWPISLLYFILTGKLANGQWLSIIQHYF